jgi:hypothetical protein
MVCAPQRYLSNLSNAIRTAILTPSSVLPVSDQVLAIPSARAGTAQVDLSGAYTGAEEAVYDVEILDNTVTTKLPSAPIFTGAGSGKLSAISATSLAAQEVTVELKDAGIPTTYAGVDFEGVRIRARASGAGGNSIRIQIDQSGLIFTGTKFSLLEDLHAGQGGENSGISGAAYDYQTAVLGTDNLIPNTAKRVAFGDDTSAIYLQYKKFSDGEWLYYFVPALKRDIPKGTPVKFVTGGRTVTVTDGITPEPYTSIVTVYDLLNALKTTSVLTTVDGVVANDRSPTGQASRELLFRTDAHVQPSVGSGSAAATGFVDTFAAPNAVTELVTATCFAVSASDYPLASLGNEYWQLKGSLSGDLGFIKTDVPYTQVPDGRFGLRIPPKLPPGFGTQKGRFSVDDIQLVDNRIDDPPICMKRMALGPSAVDQTIELTYRTRPSGNCACEKTKAPRLSAFCLGTLPTGEDDLTDFKADTVERIRELFAWKQPTVESLTDLAEGTEADLVGEEGALGSLNAIVADFLSTLLSLDELDASIVRTPSAIAVGATTNFTVPALASAPAEGTLVLAVNLGGADAALMEGKVFALAAGSTTTSVKFDFDTTGKTITVGGTTRVILIPARYSGFLQWDAAFTALKADVLSVIGVQGHEVKATAMEALAEGDPVRLVADGDTWRAWKARDTTVTGRQLKIDGWAGAAISAAATGIIKRAGAVTGRSALTAGTRTTTTRPAAGRRRVRQARRRRRTESRSTRRRSGSSNSLRTREASETAPSRSRSTSIAARWRTCSRKRDSILWENLTPASSSPVTDAGVISKTRTGGPSRVPLVGNTARPSPTVRTTRCARRRRAGTSGPKNLVSSSASNARARCAMGTRSSSPSATRRTARRIRTATCSRCRSSQRRISSSLAARTATRSSSGM